MSELVAESEGRRPRIAFLSFSRGEYDARTFRMAKSAVDAGWQVTVYARWHRGLAPVEERDGYRVVRAPRDWRYIVPGLRGIARRRYRAAMARLPSSWPPSSASGADAGRRWRFRPLDRWHWWLRVREFPLRPMGWAVALDDVVEPADIWHGMWAGSLPALARMRRRHGGRTIYDSRDIFMKSRSFARLGRPGRSVLEWVERRWAREADRVLTVNDSYADLIATLLRVPRPEVVMNCRERWTPPSPRPDRIREALGLLPETSVVLYQGILTMERGIEESMEAILQVPSAVLVLMGFGAMTDELAESVSKPPYQGRVYLLPPVPPEDLLVWSASADALVMAIQPTTLNHQYTTPQKLFESMAAGVPVVASDLPGMATIVRETGAGVLCDPTSPASIAAAIESIVSASPAERRAMRERALRATHDRYNWEAQLGTLFRLYRELLPAGLTMPEAEDLRPLLDPAPDRVSRSPAP
ncbi:MAG: glycosyltransferase [Chloroflexota bacterium]